MNWTASSTVITSASAVVASSSSAGAPPSSRSVTSSLPSPAFTPAGGPEVIFRRPAPAPAPAPVPSSAGDCRRPLPAESPLSYCGALSANHRHSSRSSSSSSKSTNNNRVRGSVGNGIIDKKKKKETRTFRRTRGLADSDDGDELTCARTTSTSTLSTSGRSVSIGSSESESWSSHRTGNSANVTDRMGRSNHRASSAFMAVMGEGSAPPHGTSPPPPAPAGAITTAVREEEWHVHAFMDATSTLLFQVEQGLGPAHPSMSRQALSPTSQILSSEEIGAFVRGLLPRKEEITSAAEGISSTSSAPQASHLVHMSSDSNCWNHPLVQCLQSWIDNGTSLSAHDAAMPSGPNCDILTSSVPSSKPSSGANARQHDCDDEDGDSTESDEDASKKKYRSPQEEESSRIAASTGRRDGTTTVVSRLGRSLRRQVSRAVSASRSRGSSSVPPQERNRSRSIVSSRSRRSSTYDVGDTKSAATPRSMSRHGSRRGASILRTPFVTIGNSNSNDTQAATTDEDTVQAVVVDPIRSGSYRKNPHDDHRGNKYSAASPPPPPPPPRRGRMPSPPSRDRASNRSVSRRRFHDTDYDGQTRSVVHRAATVITTSSFRSLSRSRPRHGPRTDASSAASPPPAPPERRMSSRRFRSLSRSRRATSQRSVDGFGRSVVNQDRGDWI